MKNLLSIVSFLLLVSSCASSQLGNSNYDPIVLKAKETSLYSSQVDWKAVNARFIELTEGKSGIHEMKEGLQFLINSLGDKHAGVRLLKDYSLVVSYTGERKETAIDTRSWEFVDTIINDISAKFSYKLLENNTGYLKVVAIGAGNVKEQADFIRKGLIDLKSKNADKWILDLRFNGGGNMEPMISGLAPLLGNGKIGGAVDGENRLSKQYKIEKGQFNNSGRIACEMNELPEIPTTEKLVVLLSRYTVSSGEMVAITFKGRENTLFMGEGTGGYTTGNGFDPVNDEFALVISKDIFADRNKVVYRKNVDVDVYMEFQHILDLKNDKQVEKALEWLK